MAPKFLAEGLAGLPTIEHHNLLMGYSSADDAGVFQLRDDLAIIQTVDFFPPIVDDPYQFGQIAAANALSDVYAMGGRPITALNIIGFPSDSMPQNIFSEVLRGGMEKVKESGAVIVGGHSIKDKEIKYGLAVTGVIDPNKIISNGGAKPGNRLYLTKPLGTGLITTGIKHKIVSDELALLASRQMAQLNETAAEVMKKCKVTAATDVTGNGLLGHTYEMAAASNVTIHINADMLPLMPEVTRLAEAKMIPAGAIANRDFLQGRVRMASSVDSNLEDVMYDPQTSGGLLIAIPIDRVEQFEQEIKNKKIFVQEIGQIEKKADINIIVE